EERSERERKWPDRPIASGQFSSRPRFFAQWRRVPWQTAQRASRPTRLGPHRKAGQRPRPARVIQNGRSNRQDGTFEFEGRQTIRTSHLTLLLKYDTHIKDVFIQIKFKVVAGSEDRAGGVVWRARDANNYYVARANALEDNVVLYKTVEGVRSALDIVGRKGGYGVA